MRATKSPGAVAALGAVWNAIPALAEANSETAETRVLLSWRDRHKAVSPKQQNWSRDICEKLGRGLQA